IPSHVATSTSLFSLWLYGKQPLCGAAVAEPGSFLRPPPCPPGVKIIWHITPGDHLQAFVRCGSCERSGRIIPRLKPRWRAWRRNQRRGSHDGLNIGATGQAIDVQGVTSLLGKDQRLDELRLPRSFLPAALPFRLQNLVRKGA